MYKKFEIAYTESIKNDIINIFKDLNIEKYMNLEGIHGNWEKDFKHMNAKIWPGTDSLIVLVVKNDKAGELIFKLKSLKVVLKHGVALFVTVSPVEIIF